MGKFLFLHPLPMLIKSAVVGSLELVYGSKRRIRAGEAIMSSAIDELTSLKKRGYIIPESIARVLNDTHDSVSDAKEKYKQSVEGNRSMAVRRLAADKYLKAVKKFRAYVLTTSDEARMKIALSSAPGVPPRQEVVHTVIVLPVIVITSQALAPDPPRASSDTGFKTVPEGSQELWDAL